MFTTGKHIIRKPETLKKQRFVGQSNEKHCLTSPNGFGGLGWWFAILGVPLRNNPFHKGSEISKPSINHKLTYKRYKNNNRLSISP